MSLFRATRTVLCRPSAAPHAFRPFSATARIAQEQGTSGEAEIRAKLEGRFKPTRLQVEDISGGCGSFYAINIVSEEFKGLPIVKQHKLVNAVLKDVLKEIHGLQLKTAAQ